MGVGVAGWGGGGGWGGGEMRQKNKVWYSTGVSMHKHARRLI